MSESQIIDGRTPVEHCVNHIAGSSFLQLDSLTVDDITRLASGRQVYLICRSGVRSSKAGEKLHRDGFDDDFVVEGGLDAWQKSGLPIVRGKAVISMARQVRIAAGVLVIVATLTGFFLHPWGYLLACIIEAGLVFAGLTYTCAMGNVLSKMPWDRVQGVPALQSPIRSLSGRTRAVSPVGRIRPWLPGDISKAPFAPCP
ncbi:MAG: DUF2892 domain-containing protein [Verrucomicrobiaceae bacterium]|nr:MAG: DUF2892 domain-containing protein [Verrucomicrobiaceae bacterium]